MDDGPPAEKPAGILRWPSYVVGELSRQGRSAIESALAEDGLSLRGYFALVCIEELAGASQQQLADRIRMDRSDLVKLLDQLEGQQFVLRKRDPADRRRHVLSLTAAGRTALERGNRTSRRITDEFFAGLTPAELRTLHGLALKALGEDPGLAGP